MNTILYNLVYDNKNTYSVNEYNKLPFEIYNQALNPFTLPFPRIEEIYRMKGGISLNYLDIYKKIYPFTYSIKLDTEIIKNVLEEAILVARKAAGGEPAAEKGSKPAGGVEKAEEKAAEGLAAAEGSKPAEGLAAGGEE